MSIPLSYYLVLAAVLFSLGFFGALRRANAIMVLISVELMLNAVNINMMAFWRYISPDVVTGKIFTIFILTVAAAEVAVGLAIVLMIARRSDRIDINRLNVLKG